MMMDFDYERLVEFITNEVKKAISSQTDVEIKSKALIVGSKDKLPITFSTSYELYEIDSYTCENDILNFDAVFITEMTLTELSDIANGRDSQKNQCAVLKALLNNIEVNLFECAVSHRKYAGKGSRELFKQYEGFLNRMISYGVKFIREQKFNNQPPNAFTHNNNDKVITESIALELVNNDDTVIKLIKGTVITPSAKDIFNHSDKKVEFI